MDGITKHTLPFSLTTVATAAAVAVTMTSIVGYRYACLSRSSTKNEYREIPLAKGAIPYFGKKKHSILKETSHSFKLYRASNVFIIHG